MEKKKTFSNLDLPTNKSYLNIHLKSGTIAQVRVDDLDQFLVDNWDDLTTEKGKRFGPARDVEKY